MTYIPVEDLYKRIGSMYKLVVVAARRAAELTNGASKLVDIGVHAKISDIALAEINEGKISYKISK
ncbi:MAG: DNA-directed RNA polymerase subunit omega [Candidatus Omnitrophota bacterium]